MPKGPREDTLETAVKEFISRHPGRYPKRQLIEDLHGKYPAMSAGRAEQCIDRLIDNEDILQLRSKGLALSKPSTKKKVKKRKQKESSYYDRIKRFLEKRFSYVAVVASKGKRGKRLKPLATSPDIAALNYLRGPYADDVELAVVEVKAEDPELKHLSQTFRYSRFADLCYVAYPTDFIPEAKVWDTFLEEARRLGIGVMTFWSREGRGRGIEVEIEAVQSSPLSRLDKDEYLAYVMKIWRCVRCQSYHYVPRGQGNVSLHRDPVLLGGEEEEVGHTRFLCKTCAGLTS